jgi:uncharacterized membrane protein
MSRNVKILIVASLGLNVLLTGVLIGNAFHRAGWQPGFKQNDRMLASKLSPEKYRLFTEVMGGARSECKQIRKQIRESREHALVILTAPEFDEQSFQREVETLHDLRGRVADRLAGATLELAKQFDPEERKLLGKYLERSPRP